jgi:hypothetical protein
MLTHSLSWALLLISPNEDQMAKSAVFLFECFRTYFYSKSYLFECFLTYFCLKSYLFESFRTYFCWNNFLCECFQRTLVQKGFFVRIRPTHFVFPTFVRKVFVRMHLLRAVAMRPINFVFTTYVCSNVLWIEKFFV